MELCDAYKILSDQEQRAKYDESIGMSKRRDVIQTTSQNDALSEKQKKENEMLYMTQDKIFARIKKKSLEYEGIDDFMKGIEEHKALHAPRTKLMHEGWDDVIKKYGADYEHSEAVERETKDKYVKFGGTHGDKYWDSKENEAYYSKPLLSILKDTIINTWKNRKDY